MANRIRLKRIRHIRRKRMVRAKIFGTPECPRLSVFRSARHIYAQVIDDVSGKTLASTSTMAKGVKGELKHGGNAEAAVKVGTILAEKAQAAGVKKVVFDRNGYRFHGRVKALADAAREKGLQF